MYLLGPLRQGKTVILRVEDPKLFKKKRNYKPVLVLTPVVQLGLDAPALLVSFPPYGSELLDTRYDLKVVRLARLGLSLGMAKALADALKKVLWRAP